ncbi:MAG: ABC transporter permease subunit [Candidatus Pacebacteria bacterium]|nr:ABC transporter permease subunit [Candidatus Paceibacterota bacterium]
MPAKEKHRLQYYTHRGRRKHPTTLIRRLGSGLVLPILLVLLASFLATGAFLLPFTYKLQFGTLLAALGISSVRLLVAYLLSLVIAIPLALLAEKSRKFESVLLPIYDVFESVPVLAFFPVAILFFVRADFLEGAAIFMLFLSMIWNIVFNAIGGLKVIPGDVKAVGHVFGLSAWDRFTKIMLPALFPPLVTGSILAIAQGWNILIVAEALHAYAPQSAHAHDLFGIGSILVTAAAAGNNGQLIAAITILIIVIALINLFVWQPLLARAERYKFE